MHANADRADGSAAAAPAAEAARYALLRRLAPALRHHLLVHLQPVHLVCDVLERRLQAAQPDTAAVAESVRKIAGFNRAALAAVPEVLDWLAPDAEAHLEADEALGECTRLLAAGLSFRGYALQHEGIAASRPLPRGTARTLLSALLLHLTDHAPAPAELRLRGRSEAEGLVLTLTLHEPPAQRAAAQRPPEPVYRPLTWDDVQALAQEAGAQLSREPPATVLRLPWAD